jgi:hypothetical protein
MCWDPRAASAAWRPIAGDSSINHAKERAVAARRTAWRRPGNAIGQPLTTFAKKFATSREGSDASRNARTAVESAHILIDSMMARV